MVDNTLYKFKAGQRVIINGNAEFFWGKHKEFEGVEFQVLGLSEGRKDMVLCVCTNLSWKKGHSGSHNECRLKNPVYSKSHWNFRECELDPIYENLKEEDMW